MLNRTNAFRILGTLAIAHGMFAFASAQAPSANEPDHSNESPIARTMGIKQMLGTELPRDLELTDDDGKTIQLGSLLKGRPLVIVPVFYKCQTACPIITDAIMKTIAKAERANEMVIGRDLDILMVSIHPKEDATVAQTKKKLILDALTPPKVEAGWRDRMSSNWHLLTGTNENLHKLVTDTLGIKYKYDAEKNLINHPTGTVFVTADGKVSSYTIGNVFPTTVVLANLALAAKNEIGEPADQSMMFGCIMLDPEASRLRPAVMNLLRATGIVTILAVAGFIVSMNIQSKRKTPFGGGDLGVH